MKKMKNSMLILFTLMTHVLLSQNNIPGAEVLDEMLKEAEEFNTTSEKFDKTCRELDRVRNQSMNGTSEEQIKVLIEIINAFEKFEENDLPTAQKAYDKLTKKYDEKYAFSESYNNTYKKVEEGLESIEDGETQRKATSELYNKYKYISEPNIRYFKTSLGKLKEYKESTVSKVVRSASSTASTIEYQRKAKDINDRLSGAVNSLKLVQKIAPNNQEIKDKLTELDAIGKKQITMLKQAWAENRFPSRYSGGSAPSNSLALEKAAMDLFKKNNPNRKCYKAVVSDGWRTIHNIFGVAIYSEIDITMAVQDASDAKLANVNFYTLKTGTPKSGLPFVKYSVGNLSDMYVSNLNK